MRVIIKFIFKIFAIILYRPKIVGKENLPKDGGALLCPNHVGNLDAAVIVAMFKRKVNVLAKEELFKNGFLCWIADLFGIYPVKRGKADMQAIKISLTLLKRNELLLMFPEGTRNGMAKGIKPKNGAVLIAATAGKPIIPIGIQGSFKPFTKVIVNIGKPIDYSKLKEEVKDKEQASELTKDLMKEIVHLRDQNVKQLKKNQTKNLT
jgi:1-acyl-sn-glycerol-3-phosphate acyltransferase